MSYIGRDVDNISIEDLVVALYDTDDKAAVDEKNIQKLRR